MRKNDFGFRFLERMYISVYWKYHSKDQGHYKNRMDLKSQNDFNISSM
ncbi:hypothetical protein [Leptospira noguchii]|uniref:Uncharacterized protein n=1 Tax=Leptospira noguchii TaxID=28182 RepID=A0AAE9KA17_9LEPT|nr:hypothetical protein [Leptospira noguchii]UOG57659.1 hypothetical protein MAL03_05890 [Leptospira noguchii]